MLPTLDLARVDSDPAGFRADLLAATHEFGFFYLTGHGVPQGRIDDILAESLHQYLIDFMDRIYELGDGIRRDFLVPEC